MCWNIIGREYPPVAVCYRLSASPGHSADTHVRRHTPVAARQRYRYRPSGPSGEQERSRRCCVKRRIKGRQPLLDGRIVSPHLQRSCVRHGRSCAADSRSQHIIQEKSCSSPRADQILGLLADFRRPWAAAAREIPGYRAHPATSGQLAERAVCPRRADRR